jgi:acetyltransferase
MHALIDYASAQGIGELFGTVLSENRTMLEIADRLGFRREASDDPEVTEVRLSLRNRAA